MRKSKIAKRIMAYVAATTIMVSVGFMGTSFYSNAETQYISAESGARLRQEPSTTAEVVNKIPYGASVQILDSQTDAGGGQWYEVRYHVGDIYHEGWVSASVMTSSAPGGTTTEEPEDSTPATEPEQPDTTQQPATQEPATQEPADTQTPTDTQEPEVDFTMPDAEVSGDGYQSNGDLSFAVMGSTMTIAEFTDAQIPAGFSRTDITYNSAAVKGLKYQYGDVYLVYLTDEAGAGDFFVLDTAQSMVHSFVVLSSGEHQLIMLVPPADTQIASSYGKTIYATDEDTAVTAYQYNQSLDTTSATTVVAEYYYIYGVTPNGIPGWYLYDDVEKTFIRSTTDLSVELDTLEAVGQTPVSEEDDSLEKMIIVAMGAICLIFIILTIVFGIRSARARKGLNLEEEYEEEDEDDGLNFIQRRKQERKYRHFMENFEEEGDEAWEHLLPEHERIPSKDKIVSQVDEAGWQEQVEKADYDLQVSDDADYDLKEDNTEEEIKSFDSIEDILLAGLEESVSALDKETQGVVKQPKPAPVEQPQVAAAEKSVETPAETVQKKKKSKEDEWKDLEFLDL